MSVIAPAVVGAVREALRPTDGIYRRYPIFAPSLLTLALNRGQGGPEAAIRSSTALVPVYNGPGKRLYKTVRADEHRFPGARRVENLLKWSEDFGNAVWWKQSISLSADAVIAPDGTPTAETFTFTEITGYTSQDVSASIAAGTVAIFSVRLKGSGTITISLRRGGSGTYENTSKTVTLTSDWQRFRVTHIYANAQTAYRVLVERISGDTSSVDVWGAQLEDLTGQTNQDPSEYVSRDVNGSTGLAWFDTANDAAKTPLHPYTYRQGIRWYETYPARANSTAYVIGEIRQWGGYYARVTVAGTSGAAAPAIAGIGETVADGTVQWEVLGYYQDDWGLLVEGAGTNLLKYSSEFENTAWTKIDCAITANDAVAPDGSMTADRIETTATSNPAIFNANAISATAQRYTGEIHILPGNITSAAVQLYQNSIGTVNQSGVVLDGPGEISGNGTSLITITNLLPSQWTRIAVISDGPVVAGNLNLYVKNRISGAVVGDYNHIWGAGIYAGSVPSTHIPTVAAAVTRASEAGNISWPISGNFNQSQGMLVVDWRPGYASSDFLSPDAKGLVALQAATTPTVLYAARSSGGAASVRTYDEANQGDAFFDWASDTTYRLAVRWNAASAKLQAGRKGLINGSWAWGSEVAYDGAFSLGTLIRLFHSNNLPNTLRNLALFDRDKGTAWLEARF